MDELRLSEFQQRTMEVPEDYDLFLGCQATRRFNPLTTSGIDPLG